MCEHMSKSRRFKYKHEIERVAVGGDRLCLSSVGELMNDGYVLLKVDTLINRVGDILTVFTLCKKTKVYCDDVSEDKLWGSSSDSGSSLARDVLSKQYDDGMTNGLCACGIKKVEFGGDVGCPVCDGLLKIDDA